MTIRLIDETIFFLEYVLEQDISQHHIYELYDEIKGAGEFIEAFGIKSLEDLQLISRSSLWVRFLQEAGEMIFTNGTGKSIDFRLRAGKAMDSVPICVSIS